MRDEAPQGTDERSGPLQDTSTTAADIPSWELVDLERTTRERAPRAPRRSSRPAAEPSDAPTTGSSDDAAEPSGSGEAAVPGDGTAAPKRRRRRRGGRGRNRSRSGARPAGATDATDGGSDDADAADEDASEPLEGSGATDGAETTEDADGATAPKRRRRRRGGRGRGRGRGGATPATDGDDAQDDVAPTDADDAAAATTPARGSRRRRSSAKPKDADAEPTAPPKGRTRRSRGTATEVTGSTRLSRSRHTRSSTSSRRRREAMPIVPRITDKVMVVTEHGERDQIAVLEGRDLVQHYVTRIGARSMVGNVYLGRVQNVLPGMEAAFVDVGRGRNAVLYAGEVNWAAEDLEGPAQRIEQALKPGQAVLVQVTKDPIGGKGARLTAQISLPGRYLVLAPGQNVTGISRRLPDDERKRLKALLKKLRPEGHGLIVRTAAEGATEEDLERDIAGLLASWTEIEKKSKKAKAPEVLYEEPELTLRVVRDLFTDEEYRELATDSRRVHELVTGYLRDVAPELVEKVKLHEGPLPVFEEFHIVEQIHKGLDRKVWLPSGGYLIIDRTEALTVIDVNTGKAVGKTNLEETVVQTNLEAAREAARQLRLRDIGGMIVIDFIDMLLEQNKRKVIDTMREAMAQDKTRSQVFDISPLGLLEVTRKRVSGGLLESFSETCPTCEGRGVLLTYDVN
ncbi:MAG: Rne/Rng family ribonuclease [Actinomycetota bacterium]